MDYSLPLRRAVLPALKSDAGVTGLIPAKSLYPSTVPSGRVWPFGRYGAPTASPFRLSGLNSSTLRFALHGFTKPLIDSAGQTIATAEDQAYKIAAAFKTALDGKVLTLEGGMHAAVLWLGSNCLVDGDEPDAWHAVANFTADVAG